METNDVKNLSANIVLLNSTISALIKKSSGTQTEQYRGAENLIDGGTSRFVRKEDKSAKYYKESIGTLKDLLKTNKEILKNTIASSTKGLGKLLMISGLVGYLLTGKKELLFGMVKGFEKAFVLPFAKIGDRIISSGAKYLLGFEKTAGKTFFKGAEKVGEKLLGGFGIKAGGKLLRAGGKMGLKGLAKIPILGVILGPVLGIYFAMERWKKKDYVGAMLEVASGIATMIPGVGTLVSLGIDAILMVKDLLPKSVNEKIDKPIKKTASKISKSILENLPVIGTIIRFQNMMKLWKTDKKKAFLEGAMMLGTMIPGFQVPMMIYSLWDSFKNKGQEGEGTAGTTPDTKNKGDFSIPSVKKIMKFRSGIPFGTAPDQMMKSKDLFRTAGDVDFSGMNPAVMNNLVGMASEYRDFTGKKIQINSVYRSSSKQKALYDSAQASGDPDKKAKVAAPGNSPHEYGMAVDIQGQDADAMDQFGLMKKWGFWRPLLRTGSPYLAQTKAQVESWHTEPLGINRQNYPSNQVASVTPYTNAIGDASLVNPPAINRKDYHETLGLIGMGSGKESSVNLLVEATKQNGLMIREAIRGMKMISRQSISVNSAG